MAKCVISYIKNPVERASRPFIVKDHGQDESVSKAGGP